MFKKINEQLVTKLQLETIMTAWGQCAEVPTKKTKVFVAFPFVNEHAEITWTTHTSDYKERLYRIEFFAH